MALIIYGFCVNSRMRRNCTQLEKMWKSHAFLDSQLWATSTSDVYQTGRGGEEMWNANVRHRQILCMTALKNEFVPYT